MNVEYLKEFRMRLGLTQGEIALCLNTSKSHYSKIEGGFELPSVQWLIALKRKYGQRINLNRLLDTKTATP